MSFGQLFYIIILLLIINCAKSENSLIQLNVLIRHGERTPTDFYPSDPYINYNWTDGVGHLSKKGKLEMYELGRKFREKYKAFIPEAYWPDDVNVSSSYSERCRNSAYLFCAGLFPPKNFQIWNPNLLWQPVPVTYASRNSDTVIVMKVKCDKYDKEFEEIKKSAKIQEIINKNRNLFEYLTEHTRQNVTTIEDVEFIYNTLEIEQLFGLTLPDWVNDTILPAMKELGAINLALYSDTQYMKRMKGGMFLRTVFSLMDEALAKKKTKILNLFFGHDLTLVHVLRSLNLTDILKPGFAAYLTFEMYSDGQVKVIYSDSANGPILINETYDFDKLKETLKPVLPNNYEKECQLDTT